MPQPDIFYLPVDTLVGFHEAYWKSGAYEHKWLGRTGWSCPLDLFVMQEIIVERRPDLIIETGTHEGGSALFLATVCDALDCGSVLTVDVACPSMPINHRRVAFYQGSSVAPSTIDHVRRVSEGLRTMVVLDSLHDEAYVTRELDLYAPLVTPGQYLVVQDTNVEDNNGTGPATAVQAFLRRHLEFRQDPSRQRMLLTFCPGGWLERLAYFDIPAGVAGLGAQSHPSSAAAVPASPPSCDGRALPVNADGQRPCRPSLHRSEQG